MGGFNKSPILSRVLSLNICKQNQRNPLNKNTFLSFGCINLLKHESLYMQLSHIGKFLGFSRASIWGQAIIYLGNH